MTGNCLIQSKKKKCLFLALGTLSLCCLVYFSSFFFKQDPASKHLLITSWMIDQIREDLAPFEAEKIKRSLIYATMQKMPPHEGFLHIKIQKGTVSSSSEEYFPVSDQIRARHIQRFFHSLAKKYRLPDVELLICVKDAYDDQIPIPVPVCVFAKKTSSTRKVLIPDFEALTSKVNKRLSLYTKAAQEHPWSSKKATIFWRGATSGGIYEKDNYLQFPRVKLVFLSQEHPDWLDAAFTVLCQSSPVVLETILQKSRPLSPYVSIPDHFAFKYLIDIDGNSCTYERCRWILVSNSTLLKPFSHNIQWYYKALQPGVHYVPLKEDLSDLETTYAWLKDHDGEAKKIADAGHDLGLAIFSQEAIQKYCATLLYEYSKIYRGNE